MWRFIKVLTLFLAILMSGGGLYVYNLRSTQIGLALYSSPNRKPSPDLILLSPQAQKTSDGLGHRVYLIDTNGIALRTWNLPSHPIVAKLGADGYLYGLILTPGSERASPIPGECDQIVRIDRDNKFESILDEPSISHDFEILPRLGVATFKLELLGPKILRQIRHRAGLRNLDAYWADVLSIYDSKGAQIWAWRIMDHLSEIGGLHPGQVNRFAPTVGASNGNSIQYISKNPISQLPAFLLSYRNLDKIILVEYPSGKILWQNARFSSVGQHDATLRQNRVLAYDNSVYASSSRIKEWDLIEDSILLDLVPAKFLSSNIMGGVRALSNGNFLVSNGIVGHLLEITPAGKMVWSFLIRGETSSPSKDWPIGLPFFRAEVYPYTALKTLRQ